MATVTLPAPDLAERVDFLWASEPAPAGTPRFRELLPDAGSHLVLRLSPAGGRAVLLGPATGRATAELAPGATYLGVRFRPGQAPRLADAGAGELADAHAEVLTLGGRAIASVCDELAAAALEDRQRVLEALLRREQRFLVTDARCRRAARIADLRGGRLRAGALADEVGLSARTLERRIRAGLGLAPKQLLRLARLRAVLGALRDGRYATLAELACACGYADQAHLARDYRALTGAPPAEEPRRRGRPLETPVTRVVHRVRGP